MKAILYAGILVLFAVLIAGCTTTSPPGEPMSPAPKTPDLVGNWSGTMTGYDEGQGFSDYPGERMTMIVTEQKNRVFVGEFIYTNVTWEPNSFAGVIGRDGMTLTIVERGGGYSYGTIITPDEIELIYADDAEPVEVAIDTLKKS